MYSCWFTGNDIFSTESSWVGIQDMDEASVKGVNFHLPIKEIFLLQDTYNSKIYSFPCPAQYID